MARKKLTELEKLLFHERYHDDFEPNCHDSPRGPKRCPTAPEAYDWAIENIGEQEMARRLDLIASAISEYSAPYYDRYNVLPERMVQRKAVELLAETVWDKYGGRDGCGDVIVGWAWGDTSTPEQFEVPEFNWGVLCPSEGHTVEQSFDSLEAAEEAHRWGDEFLSLFDLPAGVFLKEVAPSPDGEDPAQAVVVKLTDPEREED